MSDASFSSPGDGAVTSQTSDSGSALVQFEGDAPDGTLFNEAPESEWALAAHEAGLENAAMDTLSSPEIENPAPVVAAVTFLIAEAQSFIDSDDALMAMLTPGVFAEPTSQDDAIVGWSSEEPDATGTTHAFAPEASHVVPQDFIAHGVSLDWTDTLLSYS